MRASRHRVWAAEGGAAVVEFVLVSAVAVALTMALAQLGLLLWERNALMGSLSEGARVAATEGRTVDDGRRVASELLPNCAGAACCTPFCDPTALVDSCPGLLANTSCVPFDEANALQPDCNVGRCLGPP